MGCGAFATKVRKYSVDQAVVTSEVRDSWLEEILRLSPLHADDALQELPDIAKADREVVLTAVRRNGFALKFAAKPLKADREFVMAAVRANGFALKYTPDQFQSDMEIVVAAVSNCPCIWRDAWFPQTIRYDRDLVIAAVSANAWVLEHASDAFKGDKQVVSAAIRQDGRTLKFASIDLRGDKHFVMGAVRRQGMAFQFATAALRSDAQVVLAAVEGGFPFEHVPRDLQADGQVALAAVRVNPDNLQHVNEACPSYREIVEEAVKRKPAVLSFVKQNLQQDQALLHLASAAADCTEIHNSGSRVMIMSVRFDLIGATFFSNLVHAKLKWHDDFAGFAVCHPAGVCKTFCGPDDQFDCPSWACRGDCLMICKLASECDRQPTCHKQGTEPTGHSCWRYSLRWYLRRAKESQGCLLQLVERPTDDGCKLHWREPALSDAQLIVEEMAQRLQLEVFRLEMPHLWSQDSSEDAVDQVIEALAARVKAWLAPELVF